MSLLLASDLAPTRDLNMARRGDVSDDVINMRGSFSMIEFRNRFLRPFTLAQLPPFFEASVCSSVAFGKTAFMNFRGPIASKNVLNGTFPRTNRLSGSLRNIQKDRHGKEGTANDWKHSSRRFPDSLHTNPSRYGSRIKCLAELPGAG